MRKYPVISKKGNEYAVNIFYGTSITYAGMNIIISELKGKSIFGKDKWRKLRHFSILENEEVILEEYSYKELAIQYVEKYEQDIERFLAHKARKKAYEEEFEEWDGNICRKGGR